MPNKKYLLLEICGGLFTAAASVFMQHLYSLSGKELIGILFGAVNGSVWEACKTLLLPFFIWSLLESLIYRMSICRYTASKTISLYFALTPFAPHFKVFRDPATGLYGILPKHFDYGAFVLDSMK